MPPVPDVYAPLRWSLLAAMGLTAACTGTKSDTDITGTVPTDTSGGSGSGSGGEGTTDTPIATDLCVDPVAVTDPNTGADSGFVRCADGTLNRSTAVATVPAYAGSACIGDEEYLSCTTDADCTAAPYGFCAHEDLVPSDEASCGCVYSCTTDDDCGDGSACVPKNIGPRVYATVCVPADCRTDADCDSGECGLSSYNDGCGTTTRLQCRDDRVDECRADTDCADQCASSDDHARFECRTTNCDIGRPPVHPESGDFVMAAAVPRTDWADETVHINLPTDRHARAELAVHWTAIARLEHASVGSFARFTLDLMALGAPPDLLAAAHVAAADEVRHARAAFAIASAAGPAVGPGPLVVPSRPTTRETVVLDLIREACVGETCGVIEARVAATHCTHPTLRRILEGIAEDESRHAALAWKTLRWLLADADESLLAKARTVFEETIARALTDLDEGPTGLSAWGVLEPKVRAQVRREAIAAVVRPCLAAVAGPGASPLVARLPGR